MSASLENLRPRESFGRLLQIPNGNDGADAALRTVYDGRGDATALQLSTTAARVEGSFSASGDVTVGGGFLLPAPVGGVSRDVAARLTDRTVTVRDFGAKGDGTTDDTAAIQAAVNSLGVLGGTVTFSPGKYRTSAAIVIPTHCVTLRGATWGHNNTIGTQIYGSGNHDIISCSGSAKLYIVIENLALQHQTPLSGPCTHINLQGAQQVEIRSCALRNVWNGITLDNCQQVLIRDVEVLTSLATSGTSWGIGILDTTAKSFGIKIRNVRLFGVNANAGSIGLYGTGIDTVYVSQLAVTKWDYGIKLTAGIGTPANRCQFWRFATVEGENNTNGFWIDAATRASFTDCQSTLSAGNAWRLGPGNAGQITLTGCAAINSQGHGFLLDTLGTTGAVVLNGCTASGNGLAAANTYDGLSLTGTSNVTVTGGRYGGSGAASTPSAVTQRNGVRVSGTASTGISVAGANLEGNTAAFFSDATAAPLVLACPGYPKPAVSGSRGGNAALASLLTSLAGLGLVTDGTTA